MILNNTAVKIDSNMEPAKTLNFGISDVRLVVDILSKLYAYPIRTLVQEYICNGRDAMREANTWGKTPIDITVPNTLSPVFKVRDYGVGISPDRMANIFVNYGSSTKRNTNAQTGGFGIGAKSAFSYTDSFTITSFVDGIKYIYVAHLADEGGVSAISKEFTKEPNGVEISIGVKPKDIAEFRNAIQRCVRFWKESINFLGSKDIYQLQPSLTLGNMSAYQVSGGEARTIYLIDGIEYDLIEPENKYMRSWNTNKNCLNSGNYIVALNVSNGHFKIASSRERLDNTDQNKAHQKTMLDNCNALISDIINSKINKHSNALQVRLENKTKYSCFNAVNITSLDLGSGYFMKQDYVVCPAPIEFRSKKRTRRSSGFKSEVRAGTSVYFTAMIFNSKDTSNRLARKLNHYLESNQDTVLINAESIANIPFQDVLFVNRLDADALPLPPKKPSQSVQKSVRDAICWSVHSTGKYQWSIQTLNGYLSPVVFVDQITQEAEELANHITVINVPKCNKDLVLKKGMTIEQGKKYLLSKHKADVVGLNCLPSQWKKVSVLSKFTRMTESTNLRNYLFKHFPALETEHQIMQSKFNSLAKKYPLITVLDKVADYRGTALQIIIDEINKQSKDG